MMPPRQIDRYYEAVCARIRARRLRLEMSQGQLGDALDVSGSQVARMELGQQQITLARAIDVAVALEMPLGRLVRPS